MSSKPGKVKSLWENTEKKYLLNRFALSESAVAMLSFKKIVGGIKSDLQMLLMYW